MSVGMVRMDLTRRLNAHRTLNLTVSFLALVGWGAFAYSAGSSASAERDLRAALADDPAEYANAPQPTRARKLTVRLSVRCAFSRRVRSIRTIPMLIQTSPPSQAD